jgi:hypothetical protein
LAFARRRDVLAGEPAANDVDRQDVCEGVGRDFSHITELSDVRPEASKNMEADRIRFALGDGGDPGSLGGEVADSAAREETEVSHGLHENKFPWLAADFLGLIAARFFGFAFCCRNHHRGGSRINSLAISQYTGLSSTPMEFSPSCRAVWRVVPIPAKGSRTVLGTDSRQPQIQVGR